MRSITQSLQDSLLQAAFLKGESSLQAWQAWRSAVDLQAALDPGSFRLLPMAYRNLQRQGLEDPLFLKLKGISHHNWTRNQLILGELKGVLAEMHAAGVEGMALGALAQVLQGHADLSLYPANSSSLLVKEQEALQAVKIVGREWRASPGWSDTATKRELTARSSWLFYSPAGWKLRIRWRLPGKLNQPAWQEEMWERRRLPDDPTLPVCLPDPEAQIILTSLVEPYPARPSFFLQAVDLLLILQDNAGELDWQCLAETIQELGLAACFRALAEYLDQQLQISERYPGFSQLLELKANSMEVVRDKLSWQRWASLENFPYAWVENWQKNYQEGRGRKLRGFVKLLRESWQTKYLWQAPWFLLSNLLLRWRQK